ncbi:MAG: right-handed parallel beta-helix repeat-containing protein [Armatimonadetes bacterium]|nr:right-handed parallel beta-helix repeat-containing protein [Armatimonadota bacterium]
MVGAFFFVGFLLTPQGPRQLLRDDVAIQSSTNLKSGTYNVSDPNRNGVVQISGHDFTVDFKGAWLISESGYKAKLDQVEGTGILIKNARNVTLKNATVRGYRWNIRVEDSRGIKLENCDVGYSRSQRIMNGEQPINIFLDLRNVEAWRSYGAGIWVERCSGVQVARCSGSGAQNGALVVNSSKCNVSGNDFSFLSGWGIGFYGSSDNVASWNKCDFVNRPWGGGWGGDSAALVVVNGSHRNFIVGNSLTHSGDGFFLSDHRNGGDFDPKTLGFDGSCNDNVIAYNDGSWSTANAFEHIYELGPAEQVRRLRTGTGPGNASRGQLLRR